jgi:hypothetical protein
MISQNFICAKSVNAWDTLDLMDRILKSQCPSEFRFNLSHIRLRQDPEFFADDPLFEDFRYPNGAWISKIQGPP